MENKLDYTFSKKYIFKIDNSKNDHHNHDTKKDHFIL